MLLQHAVQMQIASQLCQLKKLASEIILFMVICFKKLYSYMLVLLLLLHHIILLTL